jgi:hypothetical protein
VDKRVLLRHTGTYTFDSATQDKLYEDLKAVFQPKLTMQSQGGHEIPDDILAPAAEPEVIATNDPK